MTFLVLEQAALSIRPLRPRGLVSLPLLRFGSSPPSLTGDDSLLRFGSSPPSLTGDDHQLANVELQNMLQKQQQTLQLASTIAKNLHDSAMAVIRKIGG